MSLYIASFLKLTVTDNTLYGDCFFIDYYFKEIAFLAFSTMVSGVKP